MVKKFDYVFSNPPYQKTLGGATIIAIYPAFILLGSFISEKSIMIHPARAFKGSGRAVREDVEKIVNNNDFSVEEQFVDEKEIFPNALIKGGIIITKHDSNGKSSISKGFSTLFSSELTNIKEKVGSKDDFVKIFDSIYSFLDNRISEKAREELAEYESMKTAPNKQEFKTNLLTTIPELFVDEKKTLEDSQYYSIHGYNGKRWKKYIRKDYVDLSPEWSNGWKVFVPNSSTVLGYKIGEPVIDDQDSLCTQTFITFGMFDTKVEAENCSRYLKTRFVRALLSVLKTTQHNSRFTWRHVPVQDFTDSSDLNWDVSTISDIDEQLFRKYELSDNEVAWIVSNIEEQF